MNYMIRLDDDNRFHVYTEFGSDTGKTYGRHTDAVRGVGRMKYNIACATGTYREEM